MKEKGPKNCFSYSKSENLKNVSLRSVTREYSSCHRHGRQGILFNGMLRFWKRMRVVVFQVAERMTGMSIIWLYMMRALKLK